MLDLTDSPSGAISRLDAALARRRQALTLRRYLAPSGTPRPMSELLNVPAFVRAVRADEIVGDIDSTFSNVTLSPTDIMTLWPIVKGDKLVIADRERNVELIKPIFMADILVRCDLVVAG